VRDEDIARDLTQEIFVKLFLQLSTFKQTAKFSNWLFAIANNASLDYLRRQKKILHTAISQELSEEIGELSDLEADISEELTTQILEELLNQIPPEDKLLLLLKYKEKIPIKDIQISLNLSESAVKMRLKRAREKINRLYVKYQQNE
jgi:RNA polymerase sigma-70 factor (ECF subfamily)